MNKLNAILRAKCPNCYTGDLFPKKNPYNLGKDAAMYKRCQVCDQDFVIEPGFYFGAAYISYGLNVAILTPLIIIYFLYGELELNSFQIMGILLVFFLFLAPIMFRLSRSIWIHIFVNRKTNT